MDNNTTNTNHKPGFFALMYRTRIVITKGDSTVLNLSMLFSIIALLCAPWLVIVGAIVALALGYKFAIERNAAAFDKDFEHVVKDAAENVKHAVENVTGNQTHGDDQNHSDDASTGAQM